MPYCETPLPHNISWLFNHWLTIHIINWISDYLISMNKVLSLVIMMSHDMHLNLLRFDRFFFSLYNKCISKHNSLISNFIFLRSHLKEPVIRRRFEWWDSRTQWAATLLPWDLYEIVSKIRNKLRLSFAKLRTCLPAILSLV